MLKVGDRVRQPYPGAKGTVLEMVTMPDGQECAWVQFDGKRKAVMRIVQVLELLPHVD